MKKFLLTAAVFAMLAASAFAQDIYAVLKTTQGDITIRLLNDAAPKTVENFTTHIKNGYYDGIAFHRVIKNFMIQGGDPTESGRGGQSIWGKPFEDEFNPAHKFDKPGILAMANSGPNSNGSQFFITVAPTPHLNFRHTIFGYVTEGYDVVERISKVKTGMRDRPAIDQKIIKAYIK
jgi:peptidylprolyl isomerase